MDELVDDVDELEGREPHSQRTKMTLSSHGALAKHRIQANNLAGGREDGHRRVREYNASTQ
jgi:hypothetical protein